MGADEDGIDALSPRIRLLIRLLIEDLRTEWRALDERIAVFDKEFVQMARNEEPVRRLVTIPGIGTINATARAAAVVKCLGWKEIQCRFERPHGRLFAVPCSWPPVSDSHR